MNAVPTSLPHARPSAALRLSFRRGLGRFALHAAVLLICAVWLVPTISLLATSIRPAALLLSSGWWHVFTSGRQLTFANYKAVLDGGQLATSFLNSLAIAVQSRSPRSYWQQSPDMHAPGCRSRESAPFSS